MKQPPTGLFLLVDEKGHLIVDTDQFTALRLFEDGTVLASRSSDPREAMKLAARPTTKSMPIGLVPAPIVVTGDRLEWVLQHASRQVAFAGTWSSEALDLEVSGSLGSTRHRYKFFPADAIENQHYELAPPPPAPSNRIPADADNPWDDFHWKRLSTGNGDALGPRDVVGCRYVTWSGDRPTFTFREILVENVIRGAPERLGDVLRTWTLKNGTIEVAELEVVSKVRRQIGCRVTRASYLAAVSPEIPQHDGCYVGPIVDQHCLVVRFFDNNVLSPVFACTARVRADKVKNVLKWTNIGTVKDLFLLPSTPIQTDLGMRWVSQVSMEEQVVFEGSVSDDELVLRQEHRGPRGAVSVVQDVRYRYLSAAEVTEFEKASKKKTRR